MKLSIVASNRNRLIPGTNCSDWFLKSIQWQTFKDIELVIADGGSDNYDDLRTYFKEAKSEIPMRITQLVIGEAFERSRLNNVGVRHAKGEFIMTTDVDMLYAPTFIQAVMDKAALGKLVESRTQYLRGSAAKMVYDGKYLPWSEINEQKPGRIGRIKKRTTAGGCQCMHKDDWNKIRGFDESYVGWGSEDQDLLERAKFAKIKPIWLGENNDCKLFHQPHTKESVKKDLEYQEENKRRLAHIKEYQVNPNGWGGLK